MKNRILVYDDNCPLCSWYSSLFVRFGLLPPDGRKAFSTLDASLLDQLDFDRSRNEIPLIDVATGRVYYGIDALVEILGQRCPIIRWSGRVDAIKWFLRKLYKLISFNRKVIVAQKCGPGLIDCAPDMNYPYRLLFMSLFLSFNSLMLLPIHASILSSFPTFRLNTIQLQAAHFGLVGVNVVLALFMPKLKSIEYLGQVNMIALITVLLMIPLMLLLNLFELPATLVAIYLILAGLVAIKEYLRRMEYVGVLQKNHWITSLNLACMTGFVLFLFM